MASLRTRLISKLRQLDVEERPLPGRDDGFTSLCYRGRPFAHFHNDNELDLHLTREVIVREGLMHPPGSKVHPKRSKTSHWIELRFHTAAEVDQIVRAVKLALDRLNRI